jgi:signal transduction histidine kinase
VARPYSESVKPFALEDRLRRINPQHIDIVLTVGALGLVGTLFTSTGRPELDAKFHDTDLWAVLLGIAIALPVYWRRRYPLQMLAASAVPMVILTAWPYPTGAMPFVVAVLTYGTGRYLEGWRTLAGLGITMLALLLVGMSTPPDVDGTGMLVNVVLFGAAWLMGTTARSRREAELATMAEANERAEAEQQESARAVAEERLRIAQELHDVVAHSMSVIAVQAGVGAHVIEQQPDEAKKALEVISQTSRSTLNEMRRLLGVLRGEDGARSYVPAPGLVDVPTLVEQVRAAGVPVDLQLEGDLSSVPVGIDLSAYRIVQESLTNVIKHAGQAAATVLIQCNPEEIRLEVTDDGRGAGVEAPAGANGHGLMGMRERVSVWGGTLAAGPRTGGGYRVVASMPYGGSS